MSPGATPEQTRALQFFFDQTAPQLGNFISDELWSRRVLQLAHGDTCMRHALVALSSYHERFVNVAEDGESLYGLQQYNLAIRELVKADAQKLSYLPVQLVSCAVFISMEVG